MAYYDIYIGNKPYSLYIEDTQYDVYLKDQINASSISTNSQTNMSSNSEGTHIDSSDSRK